MKSLQLFRYGVAAAVCLGAGSWLRAERMTVILSNIALDSIRVGLDQEDKTFPFLLSVTDSVPDRWKGRAHRHHPQGSITELPSFPKEGVLVVKPGQMEFVLDSKAIRPGGLTLRFKVTYEGRPDIACGLLFTARTLSGGGLSVDLVGMREPDQAHAAIIHRETKLTSALPGSLQEDKVSLFHFGGFYVVPDPTRLDRAAAPEEDPAAEGGAPGNPERQATHVSDCTCVIL